MAWHRHTSLTNFIIQQSWSFDAGVCVPLCLTNCLFPVPDSQPMATELFQSPLYGSGTVFRSISHLLRHFPSSALAWRHTSSNSVTRNYCCRVREVTLSFMDTLIALTYLLTFHFCIVFNLYQHVVCDVRWSRINPVTIAPLPDRNTHPSEQPPLSANSNPIPNPNSVGYCWRGFGQMRTHL